MDPDLSDTLTYSIVSQSVAGIFTINTTSGDLYTAVDDAYYKTNGNCTLLVQVEDQYGAYAQATLVVSITYVNTKPEIYNFTGNCEISEALPVGSLLAIFSVTDPNSRDVITERISWVPASAVYKFTINFSSKFGAIILLKYCRYGIKHLSFNQSINQSIKVFNSINGTLCCY